jgi:hypothetical protein
MERANGYPVSSDNAVFASERSAAYLQDTGLSFFTVVFDADDTQKVGHFWRPRWGVS